MPASTAILRPQNTGSGKNGWEKIGEGTYSELTRKVTETTLAEQEAHDEGKTAPSTATGLKSLSKNTTINSASCLFDKYEGNLLIGLTLPEGSKVLKVDLHVYGHAAVTTAKALKFVLANIGGGESEPVFIDGAGSTTTAYYSRTFALTEAQLKGACTTLEKGERLEVTATQTTSTASRSEIFKWYLVVEYEPGTGVAPAAVVMVV